MTTVNDFALKVERLCDFLIDRYRIENGRDGSADLKALEDLRETAADFKAGTTPPSFEGVADALRD